MIVQIGRADSVVLVPIAWKFLHWFRKNHIGFVAERFVILLHMIIAKSIYVAGCHILGTYFRSVSMFVLVPMLVAATPADQTSVTLSPTGLFGIIFMITLVIGFEADAANFGIKNKGLCLLPFFLLLSTAYLS